MGTTDTKKKYKNKVENVSFDVVKGARERYKIIAKENNMHLGELFINAVEEYIHLHDLDSVNSYNVKPEDSENLHWLESEKCYFPITPETKERLKNGEISGIEIQDTSVQISGTEWSTLSYKEKTFGSSSVNNEIIQVGCPIPIIPKNNNQSNIETSIDSNESRRTKSEQRLAHWYSIMREMFTKNNETNRINYKLDHQPYKIVRNMETVDYVFNPTKPGDTQVLSDAQLEVMKNSYSDDQPITYEGSFFFPNISYVSRIMSGKFQLHFFVIIPIYAKDGLFKRACSNAAKSYSLWLKLLNVFRGLSAWIFDFFPSTTALDSS